MLSFHNKYNKSSVFCFPKSTAMLRVLFLDSFMRNGVLLVSAIIVMVCFGIVVVAFDCIISHFCVSSNKSFVQVVAVVVVVVVVVVLVVVVVVVVVVIVIVVAVIDLHS